MFTLLEPIADSEIAQARGNRLIFRLHDESYAISVAKIREIICFQKITAVPQMPAYFRGTINLRGEIIPVMDLKISDGAPEPEDVKRCCILVISLDVLPKQSIPLGLIVASSAFNVESESKGQTNNLGGGEA